MFEELFASHSPRWDDIAHEIEQLGMRGIKGQVLSGRNLREIWLRVCRDLKSERRYQATGVRETPKPIPPSRIPQNWRPEALSAESERHSIEPAYSARASPQAMPPIPASEGSGEPAVYVQQEGEEKWHFVRRIANAARGKLPANRTVEEKQMIQLDNVYRKHGHP